MRFKPGFFLACLGLVREVRRFLALSCLLDGAETVRGARCQHDVSTKKRMKALLGLVGTGVNGVKIRLCGHVLTFWASQSGVLWRKVADGRNMKNPQQIGISAFIYGGKGVVAGTGVEPVT